jgi:hypothetical protein
VFTYHSERFKTRPPTSRAVQVNPAKTLSGSFTKVFPANRVGNATASGSVTLLFNISYFPSILLAATKNALNNQPHPKKSPDGFWHEACAPKSVFFFTPRFFKLRQRFFACGFDMTG